MSRTVIRDNYFIEYSYEGEDKFRVELQELQGSDLIFYYDFKVIKQTPEQYLDLIDDAVFWHEMLTQD